MEPDDPLGDDEPHPRLLPPDDRLWRHPSEVGAHGYAPVPPRAPRPPPRLWVVALLAALIGAVFTVGLMAATGNVRRIHKVPVVERVALPVRSLSTAPGSASSGFTDIRDRLQPTVVQVEVEVNGAERTVRGAGVMFRSDGHVLTNHHVVDGATRIVVVMGDDRRADATLVGADAWSDIAVVKVDDGLTVPVAPMGSAAGLAVGQDVMVIGGAAGPDGRPEATLAEVAALGRQLDRDGAPALLDMIQTNAPVAAASSGGALVDGTGAVVGITTALVPTGEPAAGSGFATPIDWARAVAEQLLATGRVVRVWMGVEGGGLDATTARTLGVGGGLMVDQVHDDSPAGTAGLVADDVITAVDDAPVASMGALRLLLRVHHPGDVVTLTVMRGATALSVKVRLAERPAQT